MNINECKMLIGEFISGADISISLANRIEVLLDDSFPHDEHIQETVEMLARYSPIGGDYLYDDKAVRSRLRATMNYLLSNINLPVK